MGNTISKDFHLAAASSHFVINISVGRSNKWFKGKEKKKRKGEQVSK